MCEIKSWSIQRVFILFSLFINHENSEYILLLFIIQFSLLSHFAFAFKTSFVLWIELAAILTKCSNTDLQEMYSWCTKSTSIYNDGLYGSKMIALFVFLPLLSYFRVIPHELDQILTILLVDHKGTSQNYIIA